MVVTKLEFSHQIGGTIRFPEMREYLHKKTRQLWRMCIKEFIREVAKTLSPNVDTGMSLASLIPLGDSLGNAYHMRSLIEAMIGGHGIKRGGYNVTKGHPDFVGSGDKSIAHGIERGQKAYTVDFGTAARPELYFDYTISVLQYYLHEHGLARPTSHQWESIEKGRRAFLDCWNHNYERLLSKKIIAETLKTGVIPTFYEE